MSIAISGTDLLEVPTTYIIYKVHCKGYARGYTILQRIGTLNGH